MGAPAYLLVAPPSTSVMSGSLHAKSLPTITSLSSSATVRVLPARSIDTSSEPSLHDAVTVAPEKLAWLLYLGLFPTSIGFLTWTYALRRTAAGRLGATTYLVPPIVIVLAWAMLGEIPPPLAILGGAACIAGVIVARMPARRKPDGPGAADAEAALAT